MSKAFTKEDGTLGEIVVAPRAPLPEGVPNYVTPHGLSLLRAERDALEAAREEIDQLSDDRRATALASWSQRLAELEQRIASAELIDPAQREEEAVRFGSRVTVADPQGRERSYQIVGVDEADPDAGKVAFVSPLARSLLGAEVGDKVTLRKPSGVEQLEIVAVD